MNAGSKGKPTREEFIKNLDEAEKLINELNAQWDKTEEELEKKYPGKKAAYNERSCTDLPTLN